MGSHIWLSQEKILHSLGHKPTPLCPQGPARRGIPPGMWQGFVWSWRWVTQQPRRCSCDGTLGGSSKPGLSHWKQDLPPLPWTHQVPHPHCRILGDSWGNLPEVWRGESSNLLLGVESKGSKEQELLSQRVRLPQAGWERGEGILSPLGQEFPALGTNLTEREPQHPGDGNAPGTRVRLHLCLVAAGIDACLP